MNDLTHTSGDGRVFYQCLPISFSHPKHMATLAHLYGLDSPVPSNSRILELGCADGGNLLPMAESFPNASFIGIDLSEFEISAANQIANELGFGNIEFRAADIRDVDASFGQFDYIICHGVFTWVPDDVKRKILDVCGELLSPTGVAYVNYNTLPGWYRLALLRDMMRFHAIDEPNLVARVAKSKSLAKATTAILKNDKRLHARQLFADLETFLSRSDGFCYEAYLNVKNSPLYFHEFNTMADAAGLQYLGDSRLGVRWQGKRESKIESSLAQTTPNRLQREQLLDFLDDQANRYSVICQKSVTLNDELPAEPADDWYFSTVFQVPEDVESHHAITFIAPITENKIVIEDRSLRVAMSELGKISPSSIQFLELRRRVSRRLGEKENPGWVSALLDSYRSGLVQLSVYSPEFSVEISEFPTATSYARYQSVHREKVTNLLHQSVPLDAAAKILFQHLDGSNNRDQLVDILFANQSEKTLAKEDTASKVDQFLKQMARKACLTI